MKSAIVLFLGIILGGIAGAAITLWAYTPTRMYESPKYRLQEPRTPRTAPETMTATDPCAYRRTGGYDPGRWADPGDPCRHSVPEPSTVALMAAGVVALIFWRQI